MSDITITVEGPGGNINFEMILIEKVLRESGFAVNVTNSDADWSVSKREGYFEQILEALKKNPGKYRINLIAKHIPWGG